ncbi:hypothetical protein EYZ11_010063 [Aspergillus tanneri]|uniref:chitinase n=1 Tax=Aspergillus tanneri TaxID=1220188 RepID=A0A4S3J6S5_9EURO|nr:hypothetical protein EYZ11_010063 [Aspergillus tanneri]
MSEYHRLLAVFVLLCCLALSVLAQECSKDKPCATGCCSKDGFCGTTPDHCGEGCVANCDFKLACDANNPCEIGCCSKFGFCGLGPEFCAKDICVSGCGRKGECDHGWGLKWSEKSRCPLNCGNTTVKHETCSKDRYLTRVVGYFEGWASRRPCNDFWPEQIPLGVYSHINFAFATIKPDTYEVLPSDNRDVKLYERLVALKKYDKDMKIFIALGGWTFNDPGPTATIFSDLAASEEKQKKFFKSLVSFMSTYGFDGVDLDWEYPEDIDRNGRPQDYKNFPKFMANLKKTLNQTPGRNELSITLPASYWYLQHFDLKALSKHITFFNIMSYDMHGTWDQGNKWTGSYLNAHTNLTEIKNSLDLLWRNDVDGGQVVMGLAFYGRAYTVKGCMDPGCVYASGGTAGVCSHEAGVLLNNEIVEIIREKDLKPKLYKDAAVKVVHWDDQWVSYDDRETLGIKAEFARTQCLSGVMVWAISHDTDTADFSHDLAKVTNRQVTLQRQEKDEEDYITEKMTINQCYWSNCGAPCPANWKMIKRIDKWSRKDEYMMDSTACHGAGTRSFCCPPESIPECGWYSHNNGNCKSGCPSGMIEIGSTQAGCKHEEHQTACCTVKDSSSKALASMNLYDTCEWASYPQCDKGVCSGSKSTVLGASGTGSGDVYCYPGDFMGPEWPRRHLTERKYCCNTEDKTSRFENCEWFKGWGLVSGGQRCASGCPPGKMRVAMDSYNWGCYKSGARAYCCDPVSYTEVKTPSEHLQAFSKAINNWLSTPSCTEEPTLEGSLEKRAAGCLFDGLYILIDYLTELLELYSIGKTKHYKAYADAWDVVKKYFPHLGADDLLPWIHSNKTYPEYKSNGPRKTAKYIVEFPAMWNEMVGETDRTIWCLEDLCDQGEFCNSDAEEHDPALTQREVQWNEQRDVLVRLEKRAKAKKLTFECKDKDGTVHKVTYTRSAYPGGSEWALTTAAARQAVDLDQREMCVNTRVRERPLREGENVPHNVQLNTEHVIEIKLINEFLEWAQNDPKCDVDCDLIVNFLNKEVIINAPSVPGGTNPKMPLNRIMEELGSMNNRDVFRLLRESVNRVKGDTIAVFRYQNNPAVRRRFQMVFNGITTELRRTSEAYKAATGKDVNLEDCWRRFFQERIDQTVRNARDFVRAGIHEMRQRWLPSRNPNDENWVNLCVQLIELLNSLQMDSLRYIFMEGFK